MRLAPSLLSGIAPALALAGASWRGLDLADPGLWPSLPRWSLCALGALGVAVPAWMGLSAGAEAELQAARERERVLRLELVHKLAQAGGLAPLQRQRQAMQARVAGLEEKLLRPGTPEELLSALHQAARRHGLQVELIRPEPAQARGPDMGQTTGQAIALRLSGRYHDLGAVAADVAALEPPVSLHALRLAGRAVGAGLVLEALARTPHRTASGAAASSPAAASGSSP